MDTNTGHTQKELFRKVWKALYEGEKPTDPEVRQVIGRMFRAVETPPLDEAQVFAKVQGKIAGRGRKRPIARGAWRKAVRYAAAVVVPLGCALAAYLLWGVEDKGGQVAVYQRPENAVTLTLASGERMALDRHRTGEFLTTGSVTIRQDSLAGLSYEVLERRSEELHYNVLDVPVAAEYRLVLSDGTVVYLNSDSRLKYPEAFAGDERKVYLEGEAYFEVAKDAARPFKVLAKGVEVDVLGTHFNVNAYPECGEVLTTLADGKVQVSGASRRVSLVPGEQAVASPGSLEVRKVDVREFTSWKDGVFIFTGMPLEEIMRQVYRWYGVEAAFFSEEARRATFTGVINKNMPVESLFRVIEKVVDVRFTLGKDNQVVITSI